MHRLSLIISDVMVAYPLRLGVLIHLIRNGGSVQRDELLNALDFRSGATFHYHRRKLADAGLIASRSPDVVTITPEGIAALTAIGKSISSAFRQQRATEAHPS